MFSVIGEPEEECVSARVCVRNYIHCPDLIYYFINAAYNLYVVVD